MPGKWTETFQWWNEHKPGPVVQIDKEDLKEYQSPYVVKFNLLRERGWKRVDNMWTSPCGTKRYRRIDEAYNSQNYRDKIEE